MPLSTIRLNRPVSSYTKVQRFWSNVIRGNESFIKRERIFHKKLLNVGCGPHTHPDFINLEYSWHPGIDVCWDITKKLYPFPSESLEGIYTEHCLEHISFQQCAANIKEFYRLLKPSGTVRIIVPDGELYCDRYQQRKTDKSIVLPYGEKEATGMISINRIFRDHGHQFIYDFETMALLLREAGFQNITKQKFREGNDPRLLIDREERRVESLYVEGIK